MYVYSLTLNLQFVCLNKDKKLALLSLSFVCFSFVLHLHQQSLSCFVCVHNHFINLLFVVLQQWFRIVVHRCVSVICSVQMGNYGALFVGSKMPFSMQILYTMTKQLTKLFFHGKFEMHNTLNSIYRCLSKFTIFHFTFHYQQQRCLKTTTKYL